MSSTIDKLCGAIPVLHADALCESKTPNDAIVAHFLGKKNKKGQF